MPRCDELSHLAAHHLSAYRLAIPSREAKLDAGSWIDPARGRMTFAARAEVWPPSRAPVAGRSQ